MLRGSVQRLLASLQLAPSDASATETVAGSSRGVELAASSVGTAFSGYSRFTGRRPLAQGDAAAAQPTEAAAAAAADAAADQQPPLIDTGLRPRHGGFSAAQGLAAELGGGMQWAQALTEAIILDWCASSRHAQALLGEFGSPAAVGDGGGGSGSRAPAQANTAWMDMAIQRGCQAASAPAIGATTAPAGQAKKVDGALPDALRAQHQARPIQDAHNAGRLVVPNEVLLHWLQSRAHKG